MLAQRNYMVFYWVGSFHYDYFLQECILQGSFQNQVCSNKQELQHLLFDLQCCNWVYLILFVRNRQVPFWSVRNHQVLSQFAMSHLAVIQFEKTLQVLFQFAMSHQVVIQFEKTLQVLFQFVMSHQVGIQFGKTLLVLFQFAMSHRVVIQFEKTLLALVQFEKNLY